MKSNYAMITVTVGKRRIVILWPIQWEHQKECSYKDQFWDLHSLLFNGSQDLFTVGYGSQGVKLTPNLFIVLRVRMSGAIPLLPLYFFLAWTGETFTFAIYI
jgi:hypothetical protein